MIEALFNYWAAIALMMIGLYGVISRPNLVKQVICLGIFQTGVFLFFISMGAKKGGTEPVWALVKGDPEVKRWHEAVVPLSSTDIPADNPLIHIIILTAIVVSVSILAAALAIIVNIQRRYGTVEEDEIRAIDMAEVGDRSGTAAPAVAGVD